MIKALSLKSVSTLFITIFARDNDNSKESEDKYVMFCLLDGLVSNHCSLFVFTHYRDIDLVI